MFRPDETGLDETDMSTKLSFDTATLQAGMTASLANILATEKPLAVDAQAALRTLVVSLTPQVQALIQEMLASTDPTVQQGYLKGLPGIVAVKAAELGNKAIYTQAALISQELNRWITIAAQLLLAAAKVAV